MTSTGPRWPQRPESVAVQPKRPTMPPVPIVPLMLEVQISLEDRLPSSVSDALPEKLMAVPYGKDEPVAGLLIVTLGGLLLVGAATVIVTEAVPVLPPVRVTVTITLPAFSLTKEELAPN